MTATAKKVEHQMKRVCKIIYDLQDDPDLSPDEFQDLNELLEHAMGLAYTDLTLSEFIKGVIV